MKNFEYSTNFFISVCSVIIFQYNVLYSIISILLHWSQKYTYFYFIFYIFSHRFYRLVVLFFTHVRSLWFLWNKLIYYTVPCMVVVDGVVIIHSHIFWKKWTTDLCGPWRLRRTEEHRPRALVPCAICRILSYDRLVVGEAKLTRHVWIYYLGARYAIQLCHKYIQSSSYFYIFNIGIRYLYLVHLFTFTLVIN